ncbi:5-methylcytosine-specific restriction enzyme subunit McrB [Escherichia coli]|uniref:5-methylcytosine-specific restriction enzyme subunit McrB n=1 Tax=Escherichia coli TaxID=562 RepID=A0A377APY1_ECOLX|nr:5-methylcytosine-specific restriction enzyme subunit McrB [Escherichia coli]
MVIYVYSWFAFLGEGQEASNGIYPVILYYKDFDELVLAYGISDTNEPHAQWQFSSDIPKTIAEYFQATSGVYPKKIRTVLLRLFPKSLTGY